MGRAGTVHSPVLPHGGLSSVMVYSPHTPLLNCKEERGERKDLNRVLFTLKTLSMICELSQPW